MQILEDKVEGRLNVFVEIMVLNIGINLSNIVMIMILSLREVFQNSLAQWCG